MSTGLLHPDFSRRSRDAEWLDIANPDAAELAVVLRDLARFNGAMLGNRLVLRWLRRALQSVPAGHAISLIDAGCGGGDLLRAVRAWARPRGIAITLLGIDLSPATIAVARGATDPSDEIDFAVADILRYRPERRIDFVVSSLLAHHLTDDGLVSFLRWLEATAARGWLIYDLQRHPIPHRFIRLAGKLLPLHPAVFQDGQISVLRSLTRPEWEQRLRAAGIPRRSVTIGWFLFRWLIGRSR